MAIRVTIEHGEGAFARTLIIYRQGPPDIHNVSPEVDVHEMVSTYTVEVWSGHRQVDEGTFQHRYGDDLLVLVTEAIASVGGVLPESKRRAAARA